MTIILLNHTDLWFIHLLHNTLKPALTATRHQRPPVLGGLIPRDGTVPSINHLPWPATFEYWPHICVKIIKIDLSGQPTYWKNEGNDCSI